MAYTIISQNNSTTTLSDGVNTITVPSRVNLTSGNFTIVEVNNNMATLEDGDGNVYRDIPCVATLAGEGGGGGSGLPDQTGHSGEFLTTDGTDASWASVDALPDQTGNSGKFLTTDGTDASWTDTFTNTMYATYSSSTTKALIGRNYTSGGGRGFFLRNNTASPDNAGLEIGTYSTNSVSASGDPALLVAKTGVLPAYSSDSNKNLGKSNQKWTSLYVTKINNGDDINVPAVAGKMAVQVSTLPTAASTNEGEIYQFIGTTDSSYTNGHFYKCVSDGQDPATYSWTEVQLGGGGSLPSQTGNSGKFLTTDGTDASWATINALQNKATGTDSLTILGTPSTAVRATNIGVGSTVTGPNATALGQGASASGNSAVAVGINTSAANSNSLALVSGTVSGNYSKGIGTSISGKNSIGITTLVNHFGTMSAQYTVAIGTFDYIDNLDDHSFYVGLGTSNADYKLLSADGTIPTARLTKVNSTVTIAVADWNGGTTVTKTVAGITATGVVLVSPDPTDQAAYTSAGIICTAQAADSLTFTCSTTPSADIDVNVVCL